MDTDGQDSTLVHCFHRTTQASFASNIRDSSYGVLNLIGKYREVGQLRLFLYLWNFRTYVLWICKINNEKSFLNYQVCQVAEMVDVCLVVVRKTAQNVVLFLISSSAKLLLNIYVRLHCLSLSH